MSSSSHANEHVAHHFESAEQQRQSAQFGMWIFLVTEVMFFGGLFTAYVIYRWLYPEAWAVGGHFLNIKLGGINTAILLASSYSMTLALRAAQINKRRASATWIVATILLGLVFLGIKGVEYNAKFEHHLVPGKEFHLDSAHELATLDAAGAPEGTFLRHALETANPANVQLFMSIYFSMTGLHAVHMIIGIGLLIWLLTRTLQGRYSSAYFNPVEVCGLYWHFVDIVWTFLFPLLYLVGRH